MNSSVVVVVANIYCQNDKRDNTFPIFEKVIEATRKEPGCLKYELNEDLSDETHFTFIEEWRDEESLQFHCQTDHFKEAVAHVTLISAKPIEIFKYKRVM